MGERKKGGLKGKRSCLSCTVVETVGGRIQVHWDGDKAATPMGQLAYFIEFLNLTGLWSSWVESCPLDYKSPNASQKVEVLGTWMLSILSGHKRYAHVTAIRCDGVNPGLLGMDKVISEDALRNALKRIDELAGVEWLDRHLGESARALLDAPWILDTDTTIKPLYGHQEGAVLGYNPHKRGRPSHAYHTYQMAGLRLMLGVEVCAGNEHTALHAQPDLLRLLDELPSECKPKLVRGDKAFGNETLIRELEARGQGFVLKLKETKNVVRYMEKLHRHGDWVDAGQGWEGCEDELALDGWSRRRRVIVLRRPKERFEERDERQQEFSFMKAARKNGRKAARHDPAHYDRGVLVTNTDYEILSLGQLYRDRGDAENAFDELKNQWGWGGFTTRDLHRCRLSARAVALIYNWWSLFVRLAHPDTRREALTSRPWLMASIGHKTQHAGKTQITLRGLHARFEEARACLMRVSAMLHQWKAHAAEQITIWQCVCHYLKQILAGIGPPKTLRNLKIMQTASANCGF